jgi:hypothetical protein
LVDTASYGKPLGLRGIGQGFSYLANFKALLRYRIKTKLIAQHEEPALATTFFGHKISMPVIGAPMSGLSNVSNITEEDFAFDILEGCRLAGTIGCTGSTSKPYDVHPGIVALNKNQRTWYQYFQTPITGSPSGPDRAIRKRKGSGCWYGYRRSRFCKLFAFR